LLARPNPDPTTHIETINDADGLVANVWRALQADPDAVAKYCDYPVNHADLAARKRVLIAEKDTLLPKLIDSPDYYDTKLAGYWIWGTCCWIGSGMTSIRQIPHLADAGRGVHSIGKRPRLTDAGMGVHSIGQIPHLDNAGVGVHAIGKRPHLTDAGMGVHAISQIPHLTGGKGVHKSSMVSPPNDSADVTAPYNTNIYKWFRQLSERLRNVRVVCGDWTRVCGGNWQDKMGDVGIFFDPPYAIADRAAVYGVDDFNVAHAVRAWAIERGKLPSYRIVIAGYEEHKDELLADGWSSHAWQTGGGYGNIARNNGASRGKDNRIREVLYFSPHCVSTQKQEILI